MDWGITGLTDIIIILLGILMIVVGYKKGFMNKALSFVGGILLFAFAIFYSTQLAGVFKSSGFIYNGIYEWITSKSINDYLFLWSKCTATFVPIF